MNSDAFLRTPTSLYTPLTVLFALWELHSMLEDHYSPPEPPLSFSQQPSHPLSDRSSSSPAVVPYPATHHHHSAYPTVPQTTAVRPAIRHASHHPPGDQQPSSPGPSDDTAASTSTSDLYPTSTLWIEIAAPRTAPSTSASSWEAQWCRLY
ncbi:hypothetical protein DIS24_g8598 [Lasiodiplodia hormozganensis]|uniref:Uncharacterized protein n=1 Tax=Lasiodiplodia hormozganensis TaxID=869390 RepID=A0AA39Y559_9PEZI|nr:hypothetical protein DIS24_g8598 [Lasiodiplodia hormozganensis]